MGRAPTARPGDALDETTREIEDFAHLTCPWCGEEFEVEVDLAYGTQHYVEDCQVCCHPIDLLLHVEDGVLVEPHLERA